MTRAAGAILIAKDTQRMLFQLRSKQGSYPFKWGAWGGKVEDNENVSQGMIRELSEELGEEFLSNIHKVYPIDQYHSRDKLFSYYTFAIVVNKEFIPNINHESGGYAWVDHMYIPRPLHPGLQNTLFTKKKVSLINDIVSSL